MALSKSTLALLKNNHESYLKLEIHTEEEIEQALEANGLILQYISSPTKEQQVTALYSTPWALEFAPDFDDEDVLDQVLLEEAEVVKFLSKPTASSQLQAIETWPDVIHLITTPCDEAIIYAAIKRAYDVEDFLPGQRFHHLYEYLLIAASLRFFSLSENMLLKNLSEGLSAHQNIKDFILNKHNLERAISRRYPALSCYAR